TPFCAAQVQKEIPRAHSPIGWWVLAGGLAGAGLGFGLQSWTSTLGYPLLVSGKPLFSWPAFIPIAFESGILGGALAAFAGLLWTCRLPRFFHEIFATPQFSHAGDDHFLVRLSEASSPGEHNHLLRLLQENGAVSVRLVRPAGRTRS
ncbi:MAG: DUF3341 domain-containing protein, partial [Acidobacteriota bacterium]